MQRIGRFFPVLALLVASWGVPAQAHLWQSAQVMAPLSFSVGAFGSFVFAPSAEFMGYAQVKMGLAAGFDLEARFGAGSLPLYAGAFAKWQFLSAEILQMALWTGYHYQGTSQLDAAVIFSHATSRLDLSLAPFFQMAIDSSGVRAGGGVIPGFSFAVARWVRLYVEFVIGVTPALNSGGIGAKFYL